MRSEVGEAELNYGYPRFPISTSAPRLSYLAQKHVKKIQRKLSAVAVYFKKGRVYCLNSKRLVSGDLTGLQCKKMLVAITRPSLLTVNSTDYDAERCGVWALPKSKHGKLACAEPAVLQLLPPRGMRSLSNC